MPLDAMAWLASAVVLSIGGLLSLLTRRDRLWLPLTALGAGLVGVLVGVGWHAWQSTESTAIALAMLAGGALVVAVWAAPRWVRAPHPLTSERSVALAGALLGAAGLVLAAAVLSWRGMPPTNGFSVRGWLYGPSAILAGIGLGGWVPVLSGSVWGLWLAGRRGEFPTSATDRGRSAALFSYPWLTAALLVTVLWNLAAHALILSLQPGDLWPLVAWLLGAIYLHATSSWRPRRMAAGLATLLAALALAAAIMSAVSAP